MSDQTRAALLALREKWRATAMRLDSTTGVGWEQCANELEAALAAHEDAGTAHRAEPISETTRDRLQPMPEDAGATAALNASEVAQAVAQVTFDCIKGCADYVAVYAPGGPVLCPKCEPKAMAEVRRLKTQPSPPRVLSREAVEALPRFRPARGMVDAGMVLDSSGQWLNRDAVLRLCPADAPAQETTPTCATCRHFYLGMISAQESACMHKQSAANSIDAELAESWGCHLHKPAVPPPAPGAGEPT